MVNQVVLQFGGIIIVFNVPIAPFTNPTSTFFIPQCFPYTNYMLPQQCIMRLLVTLRHTTFIAHYNYIAC